MASWPQEPRKASADRSKLSYLEAQGAVVPGVHGTAPGHVDIWYHFSQVELTASSLTVSHSS